MASSSAISGAVATASRLKPEIRLAQAVSMFENDLTPEQETHFQDHRECPNPSEVMRLTAEVDRLSSHVSGGRCFGPRLTSILHATQQFAALGDVVVGGSQNLIACGVWSLVRMTLLLVASFSKYLEELSDLFMDAGRSLPRYQEIALLYPRSDKLRSFVTEYFIIVVELCHHLLKFTRKRAAGKLASSLADDLRVYRTNLKKNASSIKNEVLFLTSHTIEDERRENSWFRGVLIRDSKLAEYRRALETKQRILDACSTYDYESEWKRTRKLGNATAFRSDTTYTDWKASDVPCTLLCIGKLGSGKSVLMANIIDDLNLANNNAIIAYFFCRFDIKESLEAWTILGSLARQCLSSVADLTKAAAYLSSSRSLQKANPETLIELLRASLLPAQTIYFIIDGLDECAENERREFLQYIQRLHQTIKLPLCLSFRQQADNTLRIETKQFNKPTTMVIPDHNPDIEGFITTELESRIKSGTLTVGNPALVLEIRQALLANAHGMFLWVALQIKALCAEQTDESIRHALANLPADLSETFSRIQQQTESQGKHYQRRILELVIAALRPLTVEGLREALGVVPGDTLWNPGRLPNNIYLTLACCGSLITIDEEEYTVRLTHHSVKQHFLTQTGQERISMDGANRTMADIIITYLNYGIFDRKLSTRVLPKVSAESIPSRIIGSTLASSGNVKGLALRFLKSARQSNFDIGVMITEAAAISQSRSLEEFCFYPYAKSHLLRHVFWYSEQIPILPRLLRKLLVEERVCIKALSEDERSALEYAVEIGHETIVKLLLEAGNEADRRDARTSMRLATERGHAVIVKLLLEADGDLGDSRQMPLVWAICNKEEAVVKLLLEAGAEVNTKDNEGGTVLLWACMDGNEAIVKLLLEAGAEVDAKDNEGGTALLWACMDGNEAIVKLLLEAGAEVDAKDNKGWTALLWACMDRNEAIIKLLPEAGAEVNVKDNEGWTALLRVCFRGNEAIVKLLLEAGAEVNTKDNEGGTALLWACMDGNEAIVKLLLEAGAEVNVKDNEGRTELSRLTEKRHEGIAKLLMEAGAKISAKDGNGWRALW